jgi:hypothetical protein
MAINKIKKHQQDIPYEMVSRETVGQITNPVSLAIWVYLTSKPENWTPRKTEIKEHFSIGDVAYKKAIEHLKDLGLYSVDQQRNDKGQIIENLIHIYPIVVKNRSLEKPYFGKTDCRINKPLKENIILKEEDIPKEEESKRKRFTPPTVEQAQEYCGNQDEAIKFVAYYGSNGWKVGKNEMQNWKSALKGWMKRAEQYGTSRKSQRRPDYASNEIDW